MAELLHCIEIETGPQPTASVIWMHGLGADATDFVSIIPALGLPRTTAVRFIFPNAPVRPVTVNAGYEMRAWYDIISIDDASREVDEAGIKDSAVAIRDLITRENQRGVASSRIVVAGFSQGGAMAYTVGLTYLEPLAGIISLSAYIPAQGLIDAGASAHKLPVFAAHGRQDDVVPLIMGEAARDYAQAQGHSVVWRSYAMPHAVCPEEIEAIGAWLRERLI